jgi:hypothetical protein
LYTGTGSSWIKVSGSGFPCPYFIVPVVGTERVEDDVLPIGRDGSYAIRQSIWLSGRSSGDLF